MMHRPPSVHRSRQPPSSQSKQNTTLLLNRQPLQQHALSRYPEIESKVERLLQKIDILVQQNLRLQGALQVEREKRLEKEASLKDEMEKYQTKQMEIEQFVSMIEEKILKSSRISKQQMRSLECKHQQQMQYLKSRYESEIEGIAKEFRSRQESLQCSLDKTSSYLNDSYAKLQQFSEEIQKLKLCINELTQINRGLVFENSQMKRRVEEEHGTRASEQSTVKQLMRENNSLKDENLKLLELNEQVLEQLQRKNLEFKSMESTGSINRNKAESPIKQILEDEHQFQISALEAEVKGQLAQIQDLLAGISRLQYKLQKSYTYITLLQEQNSRLKSMSVSSQ